jgi:hypothetical protein
VKSVAVCWEGHQCLGTTYMTTQLGKSTSQKRKDLLLWALWPVSHSSGTMQCRQLAPTSLVFGPDSASSIYRDNFV